MESDRKEFSTYHATQYTNIGNDLRFYADQRFKVVGVFLITSTVLVSVAKDLRNPAFSILGFVFSYLCLSWENGTTRWWAILFERLKKLEREAIANESMIEAYNNYPRSVPWPSLKPSMAVKGIYFLAMAGWFAHLILSLHHWFNWKISIILAGSGVIIPWLVLIWKRQREITRIASDQTGAEAA